MSCQGVNRPMSIFKRKAPQTDHSMLLKLRSPFNSAKNNVLALKSPPNKKYTPVQYQVSWRLAKRKTGNGPLSPWQQHIFLAEIEQSAGVRRGSQTKAETQLKRVYLQSCHLVLIPHNRPTKASSQPRIASE